jgi:hypothetical protein
MSFHSLPELGWRDAEPLLTVVQAADCLFARFSARRGYYLTIAGRSLPMGIEPEDVVMDVIVALSERAPERARGSNPIRVHDAYLASAVRRAAVDRSRRLPPVEPLGGALVAPLPDLSVLVDLRIGFAWGYRELRRRLASGQLPLTELQYRALCQEGNLEPRQRAARARGRRRLMPFLRELAERLYPEAEERVLPELDDDAVRSLLTAVGFFSPEVARLVAGRGSGRRARGAAPITSRERSRRLRLAVRGTTEAIAQPGRPAGRGR